MQLTHVEQASPLWTESTQVEHGAGVSPGPVLFLTTATCPRHRGSTRLEVCVELRRIQLGEGQKGERTVAVADMQQLVRGLLNPHSHGPRGEVLTHRTLST